MRHISLLSLDLRDFRSFREAHVDFRRGPGLRMVFGENRLEPRLGANGAGKSSIFDALCFCATGRSVRGKRVTDLVTTGRRTCSVESVWRIDDGTRTIRRTGPPERLFLDGEPAEQSAVDALLGLSRDRFLSSVVFGQAKPLFIDLPIPERGDLLDDVLDLGFWVRAADLATARWNAAGVDLQRLQREAARLEGAVGELPDEAQLTASVEAFERQRDAQAVELGSRRASVNGVYRTLRRAFAALPAAADEAGLRRTHDVLRDRLTAASSSIAVLDAEVKRLTDDAGFFEGASECPTCGQAITDGFAEEHLSHLRERLTAASSSIVVLATTRDRLRERVAKASAGLDAARIADRERRVLEQSIASNRREVTFLDDQIASVLGQANPHAGQLEAAAARRAELAAEINAKRSEEADLSVTIGRLDYWRQGFRRVRVFCLSRVLAELEVETMGAARSLGLVGWHVGFSGETENKGGTVKLGVQVSVRSPEANRSFDSWSPGEAQRVRCAVALGLASLIQRYSGVSYDFEVWDEPSAWLSAEGVDDLFGCLRERAYDRDKSVWVCDPRAGLSHGGFDEVWNVVKDDSGSRVEIVRGGL